ncbi:MAG TPA: hypothetical protein VHE08_07475 [Solirubrobacterales bacterium]|nr:hypothetical protein [Solirubrobacterales bacterium]
MAMAVPGAFALAASHDESKYVGKTRQHRAIRLKANAKRVRMQGFSIELHCRDGSLLIDQESGFEPSTLKRGKFNDTQYGSTDTVIYKGKVQGKKITGTLKVRDRVGKVKCSSPTVKFTARRRGH